MKYSKEEKAKALATLRSLCPPGSTIYCKLNHVSRSGMSRSITPLVFIDDEPRYLTHAACVLLDQSRDKYDGVAVSGCGMDMGFNLVYTLSRIAYPSGFDCIGEKPTRCPSCDHSNGDRNYSPHHHENGGYAISHC